MKDEPLLDQGHVRLQRCRCGPMLFLTTDQYVGRSLDRYGEYCWAESELLRQILSPGQLALEIGANIGAHTIPLAQAVGPTGPVIAIEPQRILFQILCANVAANALPNVYAQHAAVGRASGNVIVPALDYTKDANFGALTLGQHTQGERVYVVTVDELGLTECHLIKVDVEGMEEEVLAGASQTINRLRPALYLENGHQEKSAALIERLLGMDYRLYWHLPPLFNKDNFRGETENLFPGIVAENMLCLPRSAPQDISLREITSPADRWEEPAPN